MTAASPGPDGPLIACRLTAPELAMRREGLLRQLAAAVKESRVVDDPAGDRRSFRFEPGEPSVELIGAVIEAERQCCPFLEFTLRVAREDGPIWLELSGPAGTGAFLDQLIVLPGEPFR